jgi:hypothetical protein
MRNENYIFFTYTVFILILCFPLIIFAQLLGPGYQTVVKFEYQYSDYFNYTYPDPIHFEYPDNVYIQPSPYISSFPEHRFLAKISQYFGFFTNLGLRYQRGILDENIQQNIYNAKLSHELSDLYSIAGAYQYMQLDSRESDTLSYSGHMAELSGKFNFAGAIYIEPSYAYYSSSYFSPEAVSGGGNFIGLKLRQALSPALAVQLKYNYLVVDFTSTSGQEDYYHANTITLWLSQWLPTQTAVHMLGRYYRDSYKTVSFSPGVEVVQYVKWNIILHLAYRYYHNKPAVMSFLERIRGDSFTTNAVSAILDYRFTANTKIALKYRFYTSNQNIDMNTYLISLEQVL